MSQIETINQEINQELSTPAVSQALLATTFKGLTPIAMKKAIMEGMIRGFQFKDFLEKNVYAIPFRDGYSLITSIDYARKVGMRSGIVGKSAPTYTYDATGQVESCTVTVKKREEKTGYVGEYTATVFFSEYNTGKNQWATKPRTMIAKVAEMHALRMACPEQLSQAYIEEDYQQEVANVDTLGEELRAEVDAIQTVEDLGKYYKANKGKGKEFDKYVTKRKKELEETKAENANPGTPEAPVADQAA